MREPPANQVHVNSVFMGSLHFGREIGSRHIWPEPAEGSRVPEPAILSLSKGQGFRTRHPEPVRPELDEGSKGQGFRTRHPEPVEGQNPPYVPILRPGSQIDRSVSIAARTARKLVFGLVS